MPEQVTKEEPSISFRTMGGSEIDIALDGDGDLYVGVTTEVTAGGFLKPEQARELRDWLNKVIPS